MPQRIYAAPRRDGTPEETPASTYGALLTRLSELDRWGFEAQVGPLRKRLRTAVREGSLMEIHTEIAAVRHVADALGRGG